MQYCAAPLSGAFGGLLATGLATIDSGGYDGWPFIFFVEGAITVLVGVLAMCFLPHTPLDSNFLSPEEKEAAVARMRLDNYGASAADDVGHETFSWLWVHRAVLNWNTMLLSLNFFAIITPIYSFSLFLPTIITGLGYVGIPFRSDHILKTAFDRRYKKVQAQLLTVPPNATAFFMVLLVSYLSDRYQRRGIFMLMGCSLAIVGYIMLISTDRHTIQYGGTFLVAAGVFPSAPCVMGWLANNLAPHYVRATGTALQVGLANCAAFSKSQLAL